MEKKVSSSEACAARPREAPRAQGHAPVGASHAASHLRAGARHRVAGGGNRLDRAEGRREGLKATGNVEAAKAVGRAIAERAKPKGVKRVAFDRSGFKYHGRVKALADAAREHGLEF